MTRSKLVQANKKIEEAVVSGYRIIEQTVVGGYQGIEAGFVDRYLTRDGETVEEAKQRLKAAHK